MSKRVVFLALTSVYHHRHSPRRSQTHPPQRCQLGFDRQEYHGVEKWATKRGIERMEAVRLEFGELLEILHRLVIPGDDY
jgi:hypothetical protein